MAVERETVLAAFQAPPKLHRFVIQVPNWVCDAAAIIVERYGGDTSRLWSDRPTAAELRARLEQFRGIAQKKAAMAVEILERDLGVPLNALSGSDIAYDVHVRRVFLRTGFAERDDVDHMVAMARNVHPERPGALDNPAWDIGRRWCRARDPDCPVCPLLSVCQRYIERGNGVSGA
jgi:endonuclease III